MLGDDAFVATQAVPGIGLDAPSVEAVEPYDCRQSPVSTHKTTAGNGPAHDNQIDIIHDDRNEPAPQIVKTAY